jgi:hypothetical protein
VLSVPPLASLASEQRFELRRDRHQLIGLCRRQARLRVHLVDECVQQPTRDTEISLSCST